MTFIGVTGPRILTEGQHNRAREDLINLAKTTQYWSIGDARGLDGLALAIAQTHKQTVCYHQKNRYLPPRAQGAERSTRMVKEMAQHEGVLHAWPNKPCPANLKPAKSWPKHAEGSGTWGTIALAVGRGLAVELHPLADLGELPDWLRTRKQPESEQLALL